MGRKSKNKKKPKKRWVRVDRQKLDLARKVLGTSSRRETLARALDDVIFEFEVLEGVRKVGGSDNGRPDPFVDAEKGLQVHGPLLVPGP